MARREFDQILRAGKINRMGASANTSFNSDKSDESPTKDTKEESEKSSSVSRTGNPNHCTPDKALFQHMKVLNHAFADHANSTEHKSPEKSKSITPTSKQDAERKQILVDKISSLQSEIGDLREELHESRNHVREMNLKLNAQSTMIDKQKREIEVLRNRNTDCQSKCSELSQQMLLIRNERNDLQAELQEVTSNYSGNDCYWIPSVFYNAI
jgi:chromosome segregation ATPase